MRVSPKPPMVSGRFVITRTDTGSPPAGVYAASIPNAANVASAAPWHTVTGVVGPEGPP
jgi:hypothetical protein